MKEQVLFTIDSPYRSALPVKAWQFGNPEKKSLAVVGALRGNEIQQMYACGLLIRRLEELEAAGKLDADCGILVIPCANQFSMNVGRRFWAADNTDINRMFPGYIEGETTQRIAARLFSAIQGYHYGVHMTSFYLPGNHLPHVRTLHTGYERLEEAEAFGLPYVILRHPQPYDTTTLNYNWQIWNTNAFSLYSNETDDVDHEAASLMVDAMIRFLKAKGLCHETQLPAGSAAIVYQENDLHNILSTAGGLLMCRSKPGDLVKQGDLLGEIINPCTCTVLEQLRSDCDGCVFFAHKAQLINGHEVAFRVLPEAT